MKRGAGRVQRTFEVTMGTAAAGTAVVLRDALELHGSELALFEVLQGISMR